MGARAGVRRRLGGQRQQQPQLLAACLGQSAQGTWKLKIADTAPDDAGVLVKWGLAVGY